MVEPVRVLLIESQPLTRIGVRTVLAQQEYIDLIAESDNASEGYELFKQIKPDVTILGLRFPDSCTIDDLDKYFSENKNARIIMLADHAGDAEISRALKKGAAGYICKDVEPATLIKAVETVSKGSRFIPDDIAKIIDDNLGSEVLTPSEENVLRMLVGGMSNKEMSFALDVSENTVKTHIKNLYDKIGVSDRASAATMAIKRGLIRMDL
jgi:two-component system NarL family response regulator